jgi:NitT/TauT family transport system substrate-binding protein
MSNRKSRKAKLQAHAIGAICLLAISGCAANGAADGSANGEVECSAGGPAGDVTIAYQPGLGYAPLLVAKQQQVLEKAMPDVDIKWLELNSGAAIRDGVLSDDIQVASGGIGPFIIGYGGGVDWKIISALDSMPLQLMTSDPNVSSLKDLQGAGSIAMPGPDSIQSVVLRKGAQEELGDPKALDTQIVAMGHPDGMQALIAGQIKAHLTSPPFQDQEAEAGATSLLSSYDLFGEHTFNSAFATQEFVACNPDFTDELVAAISDANKLLTEDPAAAAKILSTEIGGMSPEEIEDQISAEGIVFTSTPVGIGKFADFMKEIKLISEVPEDASDYFFKNESTAGGN